MPSFGRISPTHGGRDHSEPTLVAESVESEYTTPELAPVRSDGQGF